MSTAACAVCGGAWLDAGVIAAALPDLAANVRAGIAEGAQGFLACPVDGRLLATFLLETITLDGCASCHGLWVDGGERVPLDGFHASSAARERIVPAGGYRVSGAAPVLVTEVARCIVCDAEVYRRHLVVTNRGLSCRPCLRATHARQAQPGPFARLLRRLGLR